MTVEQYAASLKKGCGADRALAIAKGRMDAADPRNWGLLPEIFYRKDRKGATSLNESHLKYLFNYWTHVYHVLRKQAATVNGKKK